MRGAIALLVLVLGSLETGCGAGGGVGHHGEYTFLPDAEVSDSSAYPLRRLLLIDEVEETQKTLFYLFDGDLVSADIGLRDLRRIAREHGRASAALEYSPQLYAEWVPDGDGSGVAAAPASGSVSVSIDAGAEGTLWPLDDEALHNTGAVRYLRWVTNPRFQVRAYFGVLDGTGHGTALSVRGPGFHVAHTLRLQGVELTATAEDDVLLIESDTEYSADYVIVDLLQYLTRREDRAPVESILRTSLPAGQGSLGASYALIDSMYEVGCWSTQRQLLARLTQVARHYEIAAEGDWAVVHNKSSFVAVDPAMWTPAVVTSSAASYCSDYE